MTRTKVNMAGLLHSCSSFFKCSIVFPGSPALRYGENLLIHDENAQFYKPWWHCSHLNFHPWGFQALESPLCLVCLKLEYSLAFFNLQSHRRKGSEKNFDMSFSLQPPGAALCFKKLLQVQQWPSPISHNSNSNVLNSRWGRYAHPEVKTTHHQFQYVSSQCKLEQMKETHVFLH
jgi:hypothetical protein